MIEGITHDHLGPIWYHSKPSDVPYFQNQFLGWDFFCCFLQQGSSKILSFPLLHCWIVYSESRQDQFFNMLRRSFQKVFGKERQNWQHGLKSNKKNHPIFSAFFFTIFLRNYCAPKKYFVKTQKYENKKWSFRINLNPLLERRGCLVDTKCQSKATDLSIRSGRKIYIKLRVLYS